MKKIALLGGKDIENSLSPFIHNFWIKKYNLSARYVIQVINCSEDIELSLIRDNYIGYNVTAPYKEKIMPFVDFYDRDTFYIRALNTLDIYHNKIYAYNTDHYGFIRALNHRYSNFVFAEKTVLILGCGGASKAIIYGLIKQDKVKVIYLYSRDEHKLLDLQNIYGNIIKPVNIGNIIEYLRVCNLVVNTVPTDSMIVQFLITNINHIPKSSIIYDVIYTPRVVTPLLMRANECGYKIITGLDMLIWQGIKSFSLWFDIIPDFSNELYHCCLELQNNVHSRKI